MAHLRSEQQAAREESLRLGAAAEKRAAIGECACVWQLGDGWWQSCCSTMCCLQVRYLACSARTPHFQPVLIVPAFPPLISGRRGTDPRAVGAERAAAEAGGRRCRLCAWAAADAGAFSAYPSQSTAWQGSRHIDQTSIPAQLPHRLRRHRRRGSRWSRSAPSWSGECTGGWWCTGLRKVRSFSGRRCMQAGHAPVL